VLPAVNQVRAATVPSRENHELTTPQIMLHPYVWAKQKPLVEYCNEHGIVVEAYSALMCGPPDHHAQTTADRCPTVPSLACLAARSTRCLRRSANGPVRRGTKSCSRG